MNNITLKKLEIIKQQAFALNVDITIVNYDVNRYSVTIGSHCYTRLDTALSGLTTSYLKNNK